MNVKVEIDCTPAEARQFLGLPNVEPMQAAVMEQLEKKMLSEIEAFSPESVMKTWFSLLPQSAEQMQQLFAKFFTHRAGPMKE
jgi:hypothetical protein